MVLNPIVFSFLEDPLSGSSVRGFKSDLLGFNVFQKVFTPESKLGYSCSALFLAFSLVSAAVLEDPLSGSSAQGANFPRSS